MHHVVDSKLEVKIYGREHHCFLVIRDNNVEYEVDIMPNGDRLTYKETLNGQPVRPAKGSA